MIPASRPLVLAKPAKSGFRLAAGTGPSDSNGFGGGGTGRAAARGAGGGAGRAAAGRTGWGGAGGDPGLPAAARAAAVFCP